MQIKIKKINEIIPYERNPRSNDKAIDAVARSIKAFGWRNPIIVDKDNVIIAVPTVSASIPLTRNPRAVADPADKVGKTGAAPGGENNKNNYSVGKNLTASDCRPRLAGRGWERAARQNPGPPRTHGLRDSGMEADTVSRIRPITLPMRAVGR
jgi:hypothetical protein